MRLLIRPNFQKQESRIITINLIKKLKEIGFIPMTTSEDYKLLETDESCLTGSFHRLVQECNVIVPVGGDGTVLNEVPNAIEYDKPIMGINSGRIGFLTQIEPTELDQLTKLKSGEYTISSRMLLEAEVIKGDKSETYLALNDIVFRRIDRDSSLVDVEVFQKHELLAKYRADGLIFSTPTGSTAYNLSAGGPILTPGMDGISMLPICPHNALKYSMVLPSDESFKVIESDTVNQCGLYVGIDGKWIAHMDKGEETVLRKSKTRLKLIDLGVMTFNERLNKKLVFF